MHATYYRPGGVYRDLPEKMPQYLKNNFRKFKELEAMNKNRQGSFTLFDNVIRLTHLFHTH
jgi:NADH-quinone oxidoreductase subunit D